MKINLVLGVFVATLVMTLTAWAKPNPEVLILPVELPGYANPVDSEALAKHLQESMQKMSPNTGLQLSRTAELSTFGYKPGNQQPPTLDAANKLCGAYGSNYLCWVSVSFQPDFNPETGSMALAAAARFWGYSFKDRKVIIDQPLSLVRAGHVDNVEDQKAVNAEAHRIAEGCVSDLAYQIVGIARQQNQRPPANLASWSHPTEDATQSRNYRNMIQATKNYQRAVRDQNVIDLNSTWAEMNRAWTILNQKERDAISRNYPDLKETMVQAQNQPIYNYGYGWPGYYNGPVFSY